MTPQEIMERDLPRALLMQQTAFEQMTKADVHPTPAAVAMFQAGVTILSTTLPAEGASREGSFAILKTLFDQLTIRFGVLLDNPETK